MFANRQQAGMLLAEEIDHLIREHKIEAANLVVLGLPRGGVPIGYQVASKLQCPLNIIAAKKIGSPYQPELAIGAVTADGAMILNEELSNYLKIPAHYIEAEKQRLVAKCAQMEKQWRSAAQLPPELSLKDKTVIVVDDGVATGMTAVAAGRSLRKQKASRTIFATPVISRHACEVLADEYDQVIVLIAPEQFAAVGQFYADFRQVKEEEVLNDLKKIAINNGHNMDVSIKT